MRFTSSLAISIAAGALPLLTLACGRSASAPIPDAAAVTIAEGGTIGTGGTPADTGGVLLDGGFVTGGTWESGGRLGTGGGPGGAMGGRLGAGGSSGGAMGGATEMGGKLGSGGGLGSGGRTVAGGMTSGSGGAPNTGGTVWASGGSSGATGPGGSVATGGTSGVSSATSGIVGSGGAPGGTSGTGGSTGAVSYPPRFVGNIDTSGSIRTDFASYWNQFTPENAGKWGSVQGSTQSTYNWKALDAMYQYCEANDIIFKESSFVWGAGQPSWISGLTNETGPVAVKTWMKAFCDRYPNTRLIDVVNEPPPHTTPPFKSVIGGSGTSGWDWIINSFVWAHEACPNAILILNDYNNAEYSSETQHTIDIVKAIQKAGAPIHAVGCQAHDAAKVPWSTLKTSIDLIASETGLPVYITQYDIGLADDAQQKQFYQDDFTMFWSNPNVKGVTIWGYVVGYTWRSNTGILTKDGTMRPAMSWLMDFLGR